MTTANVLLYLGAYAAAVAVPGPGLAALLARVLSRGLGGFGPYLLGFLVGDLVWFTLAVSGLSTVATALGSVFVAVRLAGAAYLALLAWRLVTTRPEPLELSTVPAAREPAWRAFATSLTLTLGNPKAIVFFLALLPTVLDLRLVTPRSAAELGAGMAIIMAAVLSGYALVAARARRLFRSRRALRALNVGTGTVMAAAAVGVATRR